jgi:hypothetical protein
VGELIEPASKSRADFIEECKSGKLDGVLVVYRTFNSVAITGKFDEELVPLLPDSLKFICHNGTFFYLFNFIFNSHFNLMFFNLLVHHLYMQLTEETSLPYLFAVRSNTIQVPATIKSMSTPAQSAAFASPISPQQ